MQTSIEEHHEKTEIIGMTIVEHEFTPVCDCGWRGNAYVVEEHAQFVAGLHEIHGPHRI